MVDKISTGQTSYQGHGSNSERGFGRGCDSGPAVCKRGNLIPWAAPVAQVPHGP